MVITFALINKIMFGLLLFGAVGALLCSRHDKAANAIGVSSCIAALALKLVTAFGGEWLSGCFQLPIILAGIAAAWHSIGYLADHGKRRMSSYWFLFNLMIAAMLAVTMQKTGLGFVIVWELMGLSSFALVAFDWKKREVMRAAWIYLLACEAGGLLLVWLLMNMSVISFGTAGAVTMIAFGLKAGFPLLHVWLPEAHPAAPAPVSAVMSGAMIPLGFYGILIWCPQLLESLAAGWVFFFLGIVGMLMGILFGAAQRDLKRLLAYSSVENIGIMSMALALGILGKLSGNDTMMVLGWIGAMLHMLNHALLKSTLFLGAGSVYKATHTLNMDLMGGLNRKMPWTGAIFTVSALGISGLPPFCGFAGELLIYMAAFNGIAYCSGAVFAGCVAGVVALALTGGMAAAAFAKTVSAVFAGEPRSTQSENAEAESENMVVPLLITGGCALAMTLAAPWIASGTLMKLLGASYADYGRVVFAPLAFNGLFALLLLILTLLFYNMRRKLSKQKDAVRVTWDCGYAKPDARMQYTATAFVQPLADLFNGILHQKKDIVKPSALFPSDSSIDVAAPDGGSRWLWRPLFMIASGIGDRVKRLQSGLLHVYILIMVIAVLLMLGWCFLAGGVNDSADIKADQTTEAVDHE